MKHFPSGFSTIIKVPNDKLGDKKKTEGGQLFLQYEMPGRPSS